MSHSFTPAAARAAAWSDRLLTGADVERMVAAKDLHEAYAVLYDLRWATLAADAAGEHDFEAVLKKGLYEAKTDIESATRSDDLKQVLFLPFDLQNAQMSLAAWRRGMDYEVVRSQLSDFGYFPKATAAMILAGEPFVEKSVIGRFFETALIEAKAVLEKDKGAQQKANHILAEAVINAMSAAAHRLRSRGLQTYISRFVDSENIKQLVRITSADRHAPLAPGIGGAEWEMTQKHLQTSVFYDLLEKGNALVAQDQSLALWEIELQTRLVDSLRFAARACSVRPEAVMYFWLTKLRNAEVIRTVMVSKANGDDAQDIRQMTDMFEITN